MIRKQGDLPDIRMVFARLPHALAASCVLAACVFDPQPTGAMSGSTRPADGGVEPSDSFTIDAGRMPNAAGNGGSPTAGGSGGSTGVARGSAGTRGSAGASTGRGGSGGRSANAGAGSGGAGGSSCDVDTDQDGVPDCDDPAPLGWQKRLTIDGAQVDAALSNFPLLVRIRDAQVAAGAQRDGSDIHFVAPSNEAPLDFEIERYDADGGELVAWVHMPELRARTDTELLMRYGDGSRDRSNPSRVWSGYQYVWHLAQDPGANGGGAIKDSAGRADGTPEGNMTSASRVPAVAGDGLAFDGQDDRLAFRNSFAGTGPSTVGAWVRQDQDSGDNGAAVIVFGNEASNQARFLLSLDASTTLMSAGFYSNDVSGTALAQGQWCYVVWTWDGTNSNVYVDGALAAGPLAHTGADTAGEGGAIGGSYFMYPRYLAGQLDEVRVATQAHSIERIAAEHRSQRPNSTFIRMIGAEVPIVR